MLEITPTLSIDERELQIDFIRASGPGGQNVNKVATAVQLRFNVRGSASLPGEVKARLVRLGGSRVTLDGVLVLEAKRFRTQEGNREDAIQRFVELVRKAAHRPKKRHATRPTLASKEERLKAKKIRSGVKKGRRESSFD
ncbi:MAG: aminoacyl-tRNA hydrolase [Chloroflexi bacterium]|nr:aminoacyl-tRNA hydrolase [Chloroflexota bacterium]